jgi:CDP-glycerol glycerophosphotransferase (TagB/SpsB family)
MRTIFITSFHAHISRNILCSDVLTMLKERNDLRIVITVPDYKKEYFIQTFGDSNVIIEGAQQYYVSKNSFMGLLFKRISRTLFDTGTTRGKRRYKFYWDKKLFYFVGSLMVSCLGRSFLIQKIVRWLDFHLVPGGQFDALLDKYKPAVVFSTDIHNENDVSLAQDARRRGIPVLGMWRSWDNPTQQMLRIFPDKLLAGSEELKKETVALHAYPASKVVVTGHPHFDRYVKGSTCTKEQFFSKFNLDLAKRLIFFAPGGDKIIQYNDTDSYALESMKNMDANILVRFPPGEDIKLIDNATWPSNVVMDKPGFRFPIRYGEFEIRKEDDKNLINSLYYCDVMVTGPTSLPLDAALLDKPSIVADIYPIQRNKYEKGWGFLLDHIHKLLSTRGTWHVQSREEFMDAVQSYFRDPALHSEGRAKIRNMWFSKADGKASERVVGEILAFCNLRNNN